MRKQTCLAIGLNLVLALTLTGCETLGGVLNLDGEVSPEQQARRLESIKVLMSEFEVLNIDDTKAPEWYAKQKASLEKRRAKATALWAFLDAWAELPPAWKAYWEEASETADAVLDTLDVFIGEPVAELESL